jgi:predicted dithiol-disulfide oxidoreductase (DUF899 family)
MTNSSVQVVSREEWLTAREDLLVKEKAMTREIAAFNSLRRDFPMVKIDKAYTFEGVDGKTNLSDLFHGRKQLIIYHFMLGPDDEAGCTGCSFLTDNLPSSLTHLNTRDTTLVRILPELHFSLESHNLEARFLIFQLSPPKKKPPF